MLGRWIGLLALCVIAVAAAGRQTARAEPPADPSEYVVVRYATPAKQRLSEDGGAPSLEERGYRLLPVPPGMTRDQFLADLHADPEIEYAAPDVKVYAATVPNDPYYALDQASYLAQINAPAAWDLSTGSRSVVVAVVDSGIDLAHEEFAGRLWENQADAFTDGVDHDNNQCVNDRFGCRFVNYTKDRERDCGYTSNAATGDVMDDNGQPGSAQHSHGTLVSGIAGATGNNGRGVAGIASNVRIMPIKVLDCGTASHLGQPTGDMYNVAQAIDYARRMGANIINLSLASSPPHENSDIPYLRESIQAAQDQGIIIVAAAGNHGSKSQPGPGYPAAYTQYPNVIAVGEADNENGNTWAKDSSYGPALDFAAPGVDIAGTTRTDLGSNPYGKGSGTSFATPLVSGMFALMMSRNPGLSAGDLIQIARDAATPAAPAPHGQNWAGAGVINIGGAVARVPLTITGAALHDWKDVPAGTDVRALIDGSDCGGTTTFAFGPVTRYSLRVKPAAEQPGCGAPGKAVQLYVGGVPAVPRVTWGGQNADLALKNVDISSVSPDPGPIVVQRLGAGWNNVAHLDASGFLPGALTYLPGNWTAALKWDPALPALDGGRGAYRRVGRQAPAYASNWPFVERYDVFWVDAAAGNLAVLNPNPPPVRVVGLKKGWNGFVYTGPSKSVADALSDVAGRYSQVLQYDNVRGTWLSYIPGQPRYLNDLGGMFKLQAYWVYATEDATLTMQ